MTGAMLLHSPTPAAANSPASKSYVDALKQGLSVKDSVRCASTANVADLSVLDNGVGSLDGVTVATGDRVLLKDQSTGSENGIYIIAANGAPSRATDFDAQADVLNGAFFFVEEGTIAANSGWVMSTDGAITVGTTAVAFTQFSGAGAITAGTGLTKSGGTINLDAELAGVTEIMNTGLEIGRDDHNHIDFSVDDQIRFDFFSDQITGL